jgi:hypothetical protein
MDYVVIRDEETDEVISIGRFQKKGNPEIWQEGKWQFAPSLYSAMLDGLLEDITKEEAMKLIVRQSKEQLQFA